jgi:hydroxymethylpyrimidine pyrophosphatase-like HAD family hydrolase
MMKLAVLALDYDGTIARGDVLDPSVRAAVASARTNGIVTLLVTGRILSELERHHSRTGTAARLDLQRRPGHDAATRNQ